MVTLVFVMDSSTDVSCPALFVTQVSQMTQPDDIVFVMDSSIGQAAHEQADAFKRKVRPRQRGGRVLLGGFYIYILKRVDSGFCQGGHDGRLAKSSHTDVSAALASERYQGAACNG